MDNLTNWYEQVPYADAKKIIQANVKTMARSFIAVGYYLKHIRDKELYLEDGYKSIWEFAQDIYGMSRSTASRWMSMNDKFSGGGNSPILDDRYKDFGKSQLQEMLSLPAEQLEGVTPDMTVKEIRQIGKPEVAEPKEVYKDAEKKEIMLQAFTYPALKELIPPLNQKFYELHENNFTAVTEVIVPVLPIKQDELTVEDVGGIRIDLGDKYAVWPYYSFMKMYMESGLYERPEHETGEKYIDDLDFSPQTKKALKLAGIDTVEQLKTIDRNQLVILRGIGARGLREIDGAFGECLEAEQDVKCATSHTEEEEQLPGQMDVQDYPEMAPEPEQQKEKMCSRYDGYTCNIEAVVKKHFTRRGNIEGCAGCCGICRGKGECEYTCKAVKEQITVQEPVKTVSGEVEDTAPEEIETLVNEPQFTSLFLKDILWDKEQELQQMEACNAQPDGELPERMMQEHRAVVAGLRLLLELIEMREGRVDE